MNEKEMIIKAWEILNDLTGSIKCGCNIDQDEIINIKCLYYKCKKFIIAVEESNKY